MGHRPLVASNQNSVWGSGGEAVGEGGGCALGRGEGAGTSEVCVGPGSATDWPRAPAPLLSRQSPLPLGPLGSR